jgi:diketogulonate reductase-like aldo/keto reductase
MRRGHSLPARQPREERSIDTKYRSEDAARLSLRDVKLTLSSLLQFDFIDVSQFHTPACGTRMT